jgi:hypothetical protein
MKLHGILVYAGIMLFILSTAASAQIQPKMEEYYPLQIGNKWQYESSIRGLYTIRVTGTEEINGHTYFVITRTDDREDSISYYTRIEGNKLYQKFGDNEEALF